MSGIICRERPKQKATVDVRQPRASREFWVAGTNDRTLALLAIARTAPQFDTGIDDSGNVITLFRAPFDIDEGSDGTWTSVVNYAGSQSTVELAFNFGVQTAKMFQSIKTKKVYNCRTGATFSPLRGSIQNATNASPIVITSAGHGLTSFDPITIIGVAGNTAANGTGLSINVVDANTFQILGSTGSGTYTAGGSWSVDPPPGSGIPDFQGAIGVNGDKVEGAEIEVGCVDFAITKKWTLASLNVTYLKTLADFNDRGAVNATNWSFVWMGQQLNFLAGTLRLRTAPVKWTSFGEVEIAYQMRYSRNLYAALPYSAVATYNVGDVVMQSGHNWMAMQANPVGAPGINNVAWQDLGVADNLVIGGSGPIAKNGHDYLWVFYRPGVSGNAVVEEPEIVSIEQTYPVREFADLNI